MAKEHHVKHKTHTGRRHLPRFISLLLMLLLAFAWAQVDPEAAELLERAKERHGGAALEGLESYREVSTRTEYDPDGEPVAEVETVILVDFGGEPSRHEIHLGEILGEPLFMIDQYTPEQAVVWDPEAGATEMAEAQAQAFQDSFYQGLFGLRFGSERDSATFEGEQTFLEATGRAVTVVTEGIETTYLFEEDGTLLAERYYSAEMAEFMMIYGNLQTVDGVSVPFSTEVYTDGTLSASLEATEVEINPELEDGDFELPE